MNLSKLTTDQLRTKLEKGLIAINDVETAKAILTQREAKEAAKTPAAKLKPATSTKGKKEPVVKAEKAPKEPKPEKVKKEKVIKEKVPPAPKTIDSYSSEGVSGLVRKMLLPAVDSKEAGCTYSEANKAVKEKFGRQLYASEFDRSFKVLKTLGILETKKPPRVKFLSDAAAAKQEKGTTTKVKKEKKVKPEVAPAEAELVAEA